MIPIDRALSLATSALPDAPVLPDRDRPAPRRSPRAARRLVVALRRLAPSAG